MEGSKINDHNSKINFENVLALLNKVKDTSVDDDEIIESSQTTPRKVTRSAASQVVDSSLSAFTNMFAKMTGGKSDEKVDRESVPSVINCLVKVLSGLYKTIYDQGKQIK